MAEIETDKATMEVEAVEEGTVAKLLVAGGSEGVKVNAPIAILLEEDEEASALEGYIASGVLKLRRWTPFFNGVNGVVVGIESKPHLSPNALPQKLGSPSPLSRGLAPMAVLLNPMSKPLNLAARRKPPQRLTQRHSLRLHQPKGVEAGTYDLIPLNGIQKVVARRLTESHINVPDFPLNIDCEIDELLKMRKELNSQAPEGVKISVNDMLIRASALALKHVPEANASYTPDGIAMHKHADVAVAVAIDGGLITPIENKGLSTISSEMKDLASRARDRKLKPQEYQGGSFSISNLGMMGIKSFGSIINEPHGMILSVGAGAPRPIVKDGAVAVATVMSVTLTCDHRVVDGALGAKWLQHFKRYVESPITMML